MNGRAPQDANRDPASTFRAATPTPGIDAERLRHFLLGVSLIFGCVAWGWFHSAYVVAGSKRTTDAINAGATPAMIFACLAIALHGKTIWRRRVQTLSGLTSIVITLELAFVLAMLYGFLSYMGMPGLFWHHTPWIQFIAGASVTIYTFWMLYLLRLIQPGDAKPQGQQADSGNTPPDSLQDTFLEYGPLLAFVLVLPAAFPTMRAWDEARGVEWAWLAGVAVATTIVAMALWPRSTPRDTPGKSPLLKSVPTRIRSLIGDRTEPHNPVLFMTALYAVFCALQANDWLPVLPASLSLCFLLAAVASMLAWVRDQPWKIQLSLGLVGLTLMAVVGSRDYKVLCRDLASGITAGNEGFYPAASEQYFKIMSDLAYGKSDARKRRRLSKEDGDGDQGPYSRVVNLTLYQRERFDTDRLQEAFHNARQERESWLQKWKEAVGGGESHARDGKPVLVVVCTSGGALRAAVWTEVVLNHLCCELPGFAERVRLITGASGGMLGAARFVVSVKERTPMPAIVQPHPPEYLNAIAWQMAFHDVLPGMFLPFHTRNRGDVLEDEFTKYDDTRRIMAAPSAPTECSFPPPAAGDDEIARRGIRTTFADLYEDERQGKVPSIVFSPMIAEDGRRLLITNQPMADLATHAEVASATFPLIGEDVDALKERLPREQPTEHQLDLELPDVASTPAIEFFDMFGEQSAAARAKLTLASAVRMSASFPWVTPSVVLPSDPPRHVVDAGYYDNYGVNLAVRWIVDNAPWIEENTGGVLVVQIRAFRNERSLKLYDPDDTLAESSVDDDATPLAGFLRSMNVGQVVGAAFGEWLVPLMGAAQAQYRSMFFRNDEQLLALHQRFADKGPDFFRTVIFTCDSQTSGTSPSAAATLNWYMTDEEYRSIKGNMFALRKGDGRAPAIGRDRNDLRMSRLKEWWGKQR